MYLRLPAPHVSAESKDVVKLGMGLIGTMAALVLGLLIASAKGSFDTQRNEFIQLSANVILLDRALGRYGPEAKPARDLLRQTVAGVIERIWPEDRSRTGGIPETTGGEALYEMIQGLSPKTDSQRNLQAQALKIAIDLGQTRWLLFSQKESSLPVPFLAILICWLTILFASFGLFASPNATAIAALLVCALSVAAAIFLILELDRPYGGIIELSSAPLRNALEQLGR
jgi:hypothetical protein